MFGFSLTDEGKKLMRKIAIILIAAVLITALALPSLFLYRQNRNLENQLASNLPPNKIHQVTTLVSKVGKLIDLPPDEIPTVITVTNTNMLEKQPFFTKAKNGDMVLIYTQAKRAILYDPEENKILEVGPLIHPTEAIPASNINYNVIGTGSAMQSPSASATTSPDFFSPTP